MAQRHREGVEAEALATEGGHRRNNEETDNPGNNLHVSGLSNKVDTKDLETAFAKVGRVQRASVVYDPHTRESRQFGFVSMESQEEAEAAVTALNGSEFMGKVITVTKARRGRARTPTPGKYHGPGKRRVERDRPYDPRPYDSRYTGDSDDRRGGRYDDHRDRDRRRDDRDRFRERDRERGDRHDRYDRHEDRDRRY
ncbi:hypothetical protein D9757_014329 [Collybiopsis confluens]|uniref:RRM domain-containing protein n=1 Tax=Collybiopsis confluens TaxID=2823264 RepID=A0A8H5CJX8_9AGAR|nr:hypothetical protein D9757_014329 [Collybiopsis confluens]